MPSNETKNDSSNLAFEKRIAMEDPSEFRPEMAKVGKPKESVRVFSNVSSNPILVCLVGSSVPYFFFVRHEYRSAFPSQEQDKRYNIVRETYRLMHTEQTVESVTRRVSHWFTLFSLCVILQCDFARLVSSLWFDWANVVVTKLEKKAICSC